MSDHVDPPGAGLFAVRLMPPDPRHPQRLAGRVEHVLSGRRREFADGAALLAWLLLEQRHAAGVASPP